MKKDFIDVLEKLEVAYMCSYRLYCYALAADNIAGMSRYEERMNSLKKEIENINSMSDDKKGEV